VIKRLRKWLSKAASVVKRWWRGSRHETPGIAAKATDVTLLEAPVEKPVPDVDVVDVEFEPLAVAVAREVSQRDLEKAEREKAAEQEARELAAREAAEQEARELAAREAAEQEARELAAREAAEQEARELAAREAAEQEARELAAREAAEQEARELAAREAAEQEARELAAREAAEQEARELAARETAEQEARELAAREAAEQEARELAAREAAEEEARELAAREAAQRREEIEIPSDYVPAFESTHDLYQLSLTEFEGPLDLLLLLIRRHKLDVFDIPIAFICEQYLGCLKTMEDLNMDVATEFMALAAELLHIKSKMLLPKPVEVEEEDDVDPRAELVKRLLEYQRYKSAAADFDELQRLGRDVFERLPADLPPQQGDVPLREVGVFALIQAFSGVLERGKPEHQHVVDAKEVSVRDRMKELIRRLAAVDSLPFESLVDSMVTRLDVVATLLAILELTKLRMLRVFQSEAGQIYVKPRFDNEHTALRQLTGVEDINYLG